uniref:Uncharacterized protein n=1 Tax=Zea mays TaxID=4577 RepID=A0A804QTI5_MAIZE
MSPLLLPVNHLTTSKECRSGLMECGSVPLASGSSPTAHHATDPAIPHQIEAGATAESPSGRTSSTQETATTTAACPGKRPSWRRHEETSTLGGRTREESREASPPPSLDRRPGDGEVGRSEASELLRRQRGLRPCRPTKDFAQHEGKRRRGSTWVLVAGEETNESLSTWLRAAAAAQSERGGQSTRKDKMQWTKGECRWYMHRRLV